MSRPAPFEAAAVLLKPDRRCANYPLPGARFSARKCATANSTAPATLARAPEEGRARAARFGPGRGAPLRQRRADTGHPAPRAPQSISVRGSKRSDDFESGGARTDSIAGDSSGLDRRLDLHGSARPPAGDRPRRARPQAIPLSPAMARGPRRSEVRPADRVRAGAPAHPRSRDRPICGARPAARESARGRRPASRENADSRRQRGVRAATTSRSA